MKLEIKNLRVSVDGNEVVKGINMTICEGEFNVIMGPNGSGKTTLAKAIMGHPQMKIIGGDILVDGKSIKDMKVSDRARLGLFLEFQNPVEIEGLGLLNFLNTARGSVGRNGSLKEFMNEIKERGKRLALKEEIVGRSLNHGFSGGEKKKVEVLQMAVLKPKIAILDEPDSGLDVDAVKVVADNINEIVRKESTGLLLITHYSRILNHMAPQHVHVMKDGRIVKEGGKELIGEIEEKGYGI